MLPSYDADPSLALDTMTIDHDSGFVLSGFPKLYEKFGPVNVRCECAVPMVKSTVPPAVYFVPEAVMPSHVAEWLGICA